MGRPAATRDHMPDPRLDRIARGLETLRRRDERYVVFGSEGHHHRLHATLSMDDAIAFERDHGVSLPREYRAFLTELGNGGAGPNYGLLPLAPFRRSTLPSVRSSIVAAGVVVERGSGPRPVPARSSQTGSVFPLTERWRVTDPPPWPVDANPYDGCVKLSDVGCGYFHVLVVAGSQAGEVWSDTTAIRESGSLEPVGRGFLDWYEDWLGDALTTWAAEAVRQAVIDLALPLDDELAAHAARIEQAAPARWETWEGLGYLRLAQGRHDEAQRAFEHSRDLHPARAPQYWLTQCHRHLVLGDPAARLHAAEQGLALRPGRLQRTALEREKEAALRSLGR